MNISVKDGGNFSLMGRSEEPPIVIQKNKLINNVAKGLESFPQTTWLLLVHLTFYSVFSPREPVVFLLDINTLISSVPNSHTLVYCLRLSEVNGKMSSLRTV